MKASTRLSIACLLVAIALSTLTSAYGQPASDVQTATENAYVAIVNAQNAGADTSQLITQLNYALNLTTQAAQLSGTDPQEAAALSTQAKEIAENVTSQAITAAEAAANTLPIIPITVAVVSVVIGITIFFLGPKALWKVWFSLRRNFKVKIGAASKKNESFFLTAEQLCAVALAITVLIACFAVSGFLLPSNSGEQFSELGILGPNMKLGDYPSKVVASETVSLYGYVGNQMGAPMYYMVVVKLGNNATSVNPANIDAIQEYRQVLPHNGTWIFPMGIPLMQAGSNQRIIFELWSYNQTTNLNQYQERWGQIWVNVTAPAT